jgi:hypothetical protein
MSVLDSLAEQKIAEAVSRGELDDLPGAGRPLDLEDDAEIADLESRYPRRSGDEETLAPARADR